jgi:hypothetical protein
MDKLIGEGWNNRRLDLIPEIFREGVTLYGLEPENHGRPVQTAFHDLHHEIAGLFLDGDRAAMRNVGSGARREPYGKPPRVAGGRERTGRGRSS